MVLSLDPVTAPATARPAGVPFASGLARYGDRVALVDGDRQVTYAGLADLVGEAAARLGAGRRLVLLEGSRTLDCVVTYLAALAAGHPVLLAPDDRPDVVDQLVAAYDPDVVAGAGTGGWEVTDRRTGSAHELHPDLALLLSTSGSTGSPKLVRLSRDNLQANAAAIADYLQLRDSDRAATTLPIHYCYGLSVVNSHLLAGAGLVLTDLSVVDTCFWRLVREHRVTGLAGVPFTFDLLDRVGFAEMDLPHLRYVTQAGGRLAPERVRGYAELGQRRGWDLFVMYGQTEATARMAYLPPELATTHPHAIGRAVPGGTLTLEPVPDVDDPDTGELVYDGPNVMLGYATSPADLALGATLDRLRTGDLARRTGNGLFEVVGRRSRFAKLFGLRLDLGRIESQLAEAGVPAWCVEADSCLLLAVEGGEDVGRLQQQTARSCGLPAGSVRVCPVAALPRLANGKPDYAAVRELAQIPTATTDPAPTTGSGRLVDDLVRLYAELLGRPDATVDDSFVSLGGDSLSYVEMSVRLEQLLDRLPDSWHTRTLAELAAEAEQPQRVRRGRALETSVLLRALAIVVVVGTHIRLFSVLGGAHVLLAVAGFNFARFHLTDSPRAQRVRQGLRSIARVAVPSTAFIAAAGAVTGRYDVLDVLLLDYVRGPTSASQLWFVDVLVYLLLGVTALLAVPAAYRCERRWPFAVPAGLALLGLLGRYEVVAPVSQAMRIYSPHVVFWLFALGWAAARAGARWQRVLVTGLALATVPGFFGDGAREAFVLAGLCLLVWVPTVRVPALVARVAPVLAAASLFVYLSHWQVYPHVEQHSRLLALLASLAVGVGYWWVWTRLVDRARRRVVRAVRPAPGPGAGVPAVSAGW